MLAMAHASDADFPAVPFQALAPAVKKRHQVRKACLHCASAHLSCNEHRPCDRCVKKCLECQERPRKRRTMPPAPLRGEERSLPPLKKRRLLTGRASASFDNDEYHDEEVDAKLVLHLPGMAVGGEHTTATNTPQSTSPRSEHTSHDEAAKAAGNDLDMLVVAALESDVKSDPRSQMSFVTQPSMQSMTTYSFPPYMTESPQFFYAFWIFERQPMVPVCLPTMSVGRDVVHAIRTQLVCAGLIHAETRPHVFVRLANQQVFALEENSLHHVATLGLLNPTTLLEVTCQSH